MFFPATWGTFFAAVVSPKKNPVEVNKTSHGGQPVAPPPKKTKRISSQKRPKAVVESQSSKNVVATSSRKCLETWSGYFTV